MKRLRVLMLAGAVSTVALMGASGGCNQMKKTEGAAGAIAATLHTAAVENHDYTGETVDERRTIANLIVQAAAANDQFIGVLKIAEAGGQVDTPRILMAFQELAARVDQLNEFGVLKTAPRSCLLSPTSAIPRSGRCG